MRKFDGYELDQNPQPGPDGYYRADGLEVKSGTGGSNENQREFDAWVKQGNNAYGTAVLPDGSVVPVKVTGVRPEIRVP